MLIKPLKTSLKPSLRPLFLRLGVRFHPKKGKKPSKTPPAVAYRGIFCQKNFTGKEADPETGLYYYGARYLDPKTSRWLSGDPALGDYLPSAPLGEEERKRNGNLPGQGGVFNYVNLHVYHYAGNNPIKYTDPDGKWLGFIHKSIFKNAFKNELKSGEITNDQLNQIVQGSVDTDKDQTAASSYMHSMTDGTTGQSVEEAKEKRQRFIDDRIKEFVDSDGQNYYALGEALHAVSDEDSPQHQWSSWSGMNSPKGFFAGVWHGIKEFFSGLFDKSGKERSAQKVHDTYQEAMQQLEKKREAEGQ
jgi:RHS repeat-associated protein